MRERTRFGFPSIEKPEDHSYFPGGHFDSVLRCDRRAKGRLGFIKGALVGDTDGLTMLLIEEYYDIEYQRINHQRSLHLR